MASTHPAAESKILHVNERNGIALRIHGICRVILMQKQN
jgi:hypothetical protein